MRILFATDLHGIQQKYDLLFKVANAFHADVVINAGDMLPNTGGIVDQMSFVNYNLDQHFAKFNKAGIYYLCYLGNDDLRIFDDLFDETCSKYPFVKNIAQRKISIEGYEFIGMNWVVDYPFGLKDRCRMDTQDYVFQKQKGKGLLSSNKGWQELDDWFSYAKTLPTIENELNRLVRPENIKQSIYVIHMPPCCLGLDRCKSGEEVGSKALYHFLQNNQPLLSLHGHIHESPDITSIWQAKIGETICVQPGQSNSRLTYVTIDLDVMKIQRWQKFERSKLWER
jgi:Icc-related predicted phosphoesterase